MINETYYHDYESEPIGNGNPYYCCVSCGISDPQINGRLEGHADDCEYRQRKENELKVEQNEKDKLIEDLRKQLLEAEEKLTRAGEFEKTLSDSLTAKAEELKNTQKVLEVASREEFARRTQAEGLIEKCRALMEERNVLAGRLEKIFYVVSGQMAERVVDLVQDPATGVWVKA